MGAKKECQITQELWMSIGDACNWNLNNQSDKTSYRSLSEINCYIVSKYGGIQYVYVKCKSKSENQIITLKLIKLVVSFGDKVQ